MLTVINVFSQRARGVWQTVNKAWQSFKKSHRRWLLQIQESCKFMIWQILLMFHCWQPQDPQRYRFWLDELKKVPSQMTQVYERTQEREEEWMVARHWHHRKNKTWTMSHNCGLYIPKGSPSKQSLQALTLFVPQRFVSWNCTLHSQSHSKWFSQKSKLPRSHIHF